MKIWILSDLHIDVCDYETLDADADIVVLAGDIAEGLHGLDWARKQFRFVPVLYVPGNHEYFGSNIPELDGAFAARSKGLIHALQRQSIVIDGVRFVGCTLWTDFQLFGLEQQDNSMLLASKYMADFRHILNKQSHSTTLFNPVDSIRIHEQDCEWLEHELAKPFDGSTVVITHHAPHIGSLHPRYAEDVMSAGFISDLTPLMGKAKLWIHGHTHNSFDYEVNGTRVVCNPRGYATKLKTENPDFDDTFVVEL